MKETIGLIKFYFIVIIKRKCDFKKEISLLMKTLTGGGYVTDMTKLYIGFFKIPIKNLQILY